MYHKAKYAISLNGTSKIRIGSFPQPDNPKFIIHHYSALMKDNAQKVQCKLS